MSRMEDRERENKVKVIANAYFEGKDAADKRTHDEILTQMLEWASKGWLSQKFIDGCHSALFTKDRTEITYNPDGPTYGYLTGPESAFAALAASKGKPIRVVDAHEDNDAKG